MKTNLAQSENGANGTSKRDFLQKTFVLLTILVFLGFGSKVNAQTQYKIIVINNSGCAINVTLYDLVGPTVITSLSSAAFSGTTSTVCSPNNYALNIYFVIDNGSGCSLTFNPAYPTAWTNWNWGCCPISGAQFRVINTSSCLPFATSEIQITL